MPARADLETAISEFLYSQRVYNEKLANMIAAAKAALQSGIKASDKA